MIRWWHHCKRQLATHNLLTNHNKIISGYKFDCVLRVSQLFSFPFDGKNIWIWFHHLDCMDFLLLLPNASFFSSPFSSLSHFGRTQKRKNQPAIVIIPQMLYNSITNANSHHRWFVKWKKKLATLRGVREKKTLENRSNHKFQHLTRL